MNLKFQIIFRYFRTQSPIVRVTAFLSSLGVVLGVACLVLTMSIVSGVQSFIQNSITDLTGEMMVVYKGESFQPDELDKKLKSLSKDYERLTPFISPQGVVVNQGKVLGVMIHGLEPSTALSVVRPNKRVIKGEFTLGKSDGTEGVYEAMVGKEMAKKLNLKLGDVFRVVVPKLSTEKVQSFKPMVQKFILKGILDLGKYDYNEKIIITSDQAVQEMLHIGKEYVGAYLKFKTPESALLQTRQIEDSLGLDYRVKNWKEINYNFLSAIELEKVVIFIVILFIVIVASFNVSSSIFVSVLRKFSSIAVLKTLGASQKFLRSLFILQGTAMGVLSSLLGIALGILLALLIRYTHLIDVPGDIYKFDHLPVDIRFSDILSIFIVTVVICMLSSIIPAIKGAKLKPVEGLKYE